MKHTVTVMSHMAGDVARFVVRTSVPPGRNLLIPTQDLPRGVVVAARDGDREFQVVLDEGYRPDHSTWEDASGISLL